LYGRSIAFLETTAPFRVNSTAVLRLLYRRKTG